jgi:N-acetylglutamate synthase-like GNAT family acetyltransferase
MIKLREAVCSDAHEAIEMRGKTKQNALSAEQLREFGVTEQSWSDGISTGAFHGTIAEQDETMVGYCFADTHSGEILVLAILAAAENQGLGSRLLKQQMHHMHKQGWNRLFLACAPYPEYRSYGFYRHLGWVSTGKIINDEEILEYTFNHSQ